MENNIFKCRCSGIGSIMTEPQSKADKEAGLLGKTAKTFVDEVWLKDRFGFREDVMTPEMKKGMICEQDSIRLVQEVLKGEFRVTYRKLIENEFIKGTPDIILKDCVEDIKTSFNLKTFHNAELSKDYEFQLRGYMILANLQKARLIYCLVDTPDEIIVDLKKKIWFQFGMNETNEDYIRMSMQIEHNHKPSLMEGLTSSMRVKIFEIERDPEIDQRIIDQVIKCRNYYQSIKL